MGETVTREEVKENVRVSADLDRHVEWLREDRSLDVEKVFLHNVNREQFVDAFGERVLPEFD